jgi:TolB protein
MMVFYKKCSTVIRHILIGFFFLSSLRSATIDPLPVEVHAQKTGAIKFAIVLIIDNIHSNDDAMLLRDLGHHLKKDLEFTKQFKVGGGFLHELFSLPSNPSKQYLQELHLNGYEFALFIQPVDPPLLAMLEWRLYDLSSCSMIKGKRYSKKGSDHRVWAHTIADSVWPELAQVPGFFSTKIAYCKDIKDEHARAIKHIYIADYDGSHEQVLISTHTLNVAPRWNVDTAFPVLFYSEHTSVNVRLMMTTMEKKRQIVVNFDGLTMLPSFSHDGKRVAFCASRGAGACDLYCYDQGNLKRLTQNQGNNLAPVFTENQDLLFYCSDREGLPQIYSYTFSTGNSERITPSGYCVCPTYCHTNKSLAYAKMVKGIMQLFMYNTGSKQHTQLTFDESNKDECSWSPCGNYLLFATQQGLKSRIAMLQIHTRETWFVTKPTEICSYPTWSPLYAQVPVVS